MITPLNSNILLKPVSAETTTKSGIVLAAAVDMDANSYGAHVGHAVVVAIPDGMDFPKGFEVKVGDEVIYDKALGQKLIVDGEERFLAKAFDILAVIKKD